jgi:hypothetical protein
LTANDRLPYLRANSAVTEALEGEVIWAARRRCVNLDGARLHGVADDDSLVHILREDAALHAGNRLS